jgi:hypothetical protein
LRLVAQSAGTEAVRTQARPSGKPQADAGRGRVLLGAIALAAAVHALAFAFAAAWPVPNGQGGLISPLLADFGIDLAHYQNMRAIYFGEPGSADVLFETGNASGWGQAMFSGPVLPFLLELFDYGPGNSLPLAIFYLALACGLAAAWLTWLARQGASPLCLMLFALLPNPLWFMLNISTDLLFAAATAAFYLVYFSGPPTVRRLAASAALVLVALAIRPNAVALALFLLIHASWKAGDRNAHKLMLAAAAVVLLPVAAFYGPYLYAFVIGSSDKPLYFGLTQADFFAGVFPALPEALDRTLSLLVLASFKLLALVGLRTSAGDTAALFVLMRAAPGVILLPGLLWGLFRADSAHRLLLALFIAPILAGATQDRYMLPVEPILFLFGWRWWAGRWERVRPGAGGSARMRLPET